VRLLSAKNGNVMVVGDDSQSIYSFRGATIRNILDFPEQYPGCKVIKLEENYRSTQPILNLTNEILRRARD
jgi:DNA helicase-2/ATP-dependent DNA helicase PcrA